MSNLKIETAEAFLPLLDSARYKGAYGGRGSAKSHFFADLLIEDHLMNPGMRSVCVREVQKSLEQSVKRLLEDKIEKYNLHKYFEPTAKNIQTHGEGIILFQGMQNHTADSIKSLEGFDRAWVEEAQNFSQRSLTLLRPTIRKENSQLWFSWNPEHKDDPIDKLLRDQVPNDSIVVNVSYRDNPWFPDVLRKEMEYDRLHDVDAYNHVWEGGYNQKSDAQILKGKWIIDVFDIDETFDGPYLGADWGFSQDPTTLVELYIKDDVLYIFDEVYSIGCDIDDTPELFDHIPNARKYKIRADSARPETISYMRRKGFNIEGVAKPKNSVEDGIARLRGFKKIVIHSRCKYTQKEARLYSYKQDRLTGDITPVIIDSHNHCIDAIRYALYPIIFNKTGGGFLLL